MSIGASREAAALLVDSVVDANDEDLVRSVMAGDTTAFDRLVERYAARMFRMIRARIRDVSLTEDLVQETFLNAFVALPDYRFDARFFTWLCRIMITTVAQHRRKAARRKELDAQSPGRSGSGRPADGLSEAREDHERVRRALADLPEEYRTALLLREWGELSYAEIATILDCPLGTVDSRIARARRLLKERLSSDE